MSSQTSAIIAFSGILLSGFVSFLIAHWKLATEKRLEIASYQAIRKLLKQNEWKIRSFGAIKRHLPGFTDDELRKLLVAAGALAFQDSNGDELWGLLKLNKHRLRPKNEPKPVIPLPAPAEGPSVSSSTIPPAPVHPRDSQE